MSDGGNSDTKRGAGYLREKFIIGLSKVTGDEVDLAVVKATSHKLKAPNEKYAQRLLAASYGHCKFDSKRGTNVCVYIVQELEKRSHVHSWIVVMKTLIMFHRLMVDGSEEMNVAIQQSRNVFCHRNIKDLSDCQDGAAQKVLIAEYIRYLEERSTAQRVLGAASRIESEEFRQHVASLDVDKLAGFVEVLTNQLEALVQVEYRDRIVDNWCTMELYQKLISDAKLLYHILSKRFVFVLDGFEDYPLSLKRAWLTLYRRFDYCTGKLSTIFDAMNASARVFAVPIPTLKPFPPSLLQRLEDDIRFSALPSEEATCTLESLGISATKDEPSPPAPKDSGPLTPQDTAVPPIASPDDVQLAFATGMAMTEPNNISPAASATGPPVAVANPLDDLFGGPVSVPAADAAAKMAPSQCKPEGSSGFTGAMWTSGAPVSDGVLGQESAHFLWGTGAPSGAAPASFTHSTVMAKAVDHHGVSGQMADWGVGEVPAGDSAVGVAAHQVSPPHFASSIQWGFGEGGNSSTSVPPPHFAGGAEDTFKLLASEGQTQWKFQ